MNARLLRAAAVVALTGAIVLACTSTGDVSPTSSSPAERQQLVFRAVDSDADGRLTRREFTDFIFTESFIALDVDGNERLTIVEWVGPDHGEDARVVFVEMDIDGDSYLLLEEYSSHGRRRTTVGHAFRTLDANGDDVLEIDELSLLEDWS